MLTASLPCRQSLPSHTLTALLPVSAPAREEGNVNNIFLSMLLLFYQTENVESTKLLLPLCILLLIGDLAVDREVVSYSKSVRINGGEGGKKVPMDELGLSFPALPIFTVIG